MVRGLEATERDVHGVPTRVVSVKEAERAGYPFGAKSDYDILQLSGTATLTGRDCPMEWGKNAQQFFKDFCGDTCMAIAGLERGDKKDHRHVQMAIQIRAKVEHRASRSSRTAGQTNDRPHALPKLAHRRLGRTRAPSPRAASSV